jgi:hypothetical protein
MDDMAFGLLPTLHKFLRARQPQCFWMGAVHLTHSYSLRRFCIWKSNHYRGGGMGTALKEGEAG